MITTLENNLRFAYLNCPSEVAYIGLGIQVGSSDERPEEYGISHFIEHMLFKGTKTRSNYKVISYLESIGGELNAYTTKEETIIYAAVPKTYINRAIELIADIVFNSTFPDNEMEKEKDVVIDEINSYKDNPSEVIFDEFEELVFKDHPLGHNILGTEETVNSFTQGMIKAFIERNYSTEKMVLFVMTDVDDQKVLKMVQKHFSSVQYSTNKASERQVVNYVKRELEMKENTYQAHSMLGTVAYAFNDPRRLILNLLCNLLGGPAMNARLNYQLRERNGIGYNIEVHYAPYVNTGIVYIYWGSDVKNVRKSKAIIFKELKKLIAQPLSEQTLKRIKQQYLGQMLIAAESNESRFLNFGKSIMHFNTYRTLTDLQQKIDAITAEDIQAVAKAVLKPENLSALYLT